MHKSFTSLRQNNPGPADQLALCTRQTVRCRLRHSRCRYRVLRAKSTFSPAFQTIPATKHQIQTRKQAIKHYTDKVGYIQTNIDSLEETIQKKRENMNYLITVMQSKIQAQAGGTS